MLAVPTPESAAVITTHIPNLPVRRGKVRDVYDLGDELLIVATDRISAYDVVLPTAIPGKGEVLTRMSRFWFDMLADHVPHHLIEVIEDRTPPGLEAHLDVLRGRTMRCRKCQVVPIECVVRGYLAGSGWNEYRESGTVCGVALPAGLRQCDPLPTPIFTPATKSESGHDENITFDRACEIAGEQCMTWLRDRSLMTYVTAAAYARQRGILIADTKFEFGVDADGQLVLADEVLTPDSSRFWPADAYRAGRGQPSLDKQYVRDYLESIGWNKQPPVPNLPEEIVAGAATRYRRIFTILTGQDLN
jgi:phosphoribosylaminoimidazole-succinocarboxamide synthase